VGTTETQPIMMSAAGSSVTVSSDASSSSQFVLDGATFPFTIAACVYIEDGRIAYRHSSAVQRQSQLEPQ
jgi:hypothetical protein